VNLDLSHLRGKLYGVNTYIFLFYHCWLNFQLKSLTLTHGFLFAMYAGKYAQVTNNPENDGCINAVLLV